jgi:hypothetical protein
LSLDSLAVEFIILRGEKRLNNKEGEHKRRNKNKKMWKQKGSSRKKKGKEYVLKEESRRKSGQIGFVI